MHLQVCLPERVTTYRLAPAPFSAIAQRFYSMLGWRLIYFGLVVALAVAAFATPFPVRHSISALTVSIEILAAVGALALLGWLACTRPREPFRAIGKLISERAIGDAALLFITSTLFFSLLPPLKAMIPSYRGFWADPFLAEADRAIFGRDAWKVAHDLLPGYSAHVDYLYASWSLSIVCVAAAVALCGSEERKAKFFLTWALSWTVLGVFTATALASAGPIFGPQLGLGFQGLVPVLADAPAATLFRDLLWQMHGTNNAGFGGGISAAPSMHCALTFIFVFASYGTRWFLPALTYSVMIWFGSVYLGWHYAVDGLISLLGVALLWLGAGRIVCSPFARSSSSEVVEARSESGFRDYSM